jgi:hypothetical protein
MRWHVVKDLAEQGAEGGGGGGGKADAGFAGGPDCDVNSRVEEVRYVVEAFYVWDSNDCCGGATGVELAYDARDTLEAE